MIYLMAGISGSGKSTYIKNHKENNDLVICPDTLRKEIAGTISDQSKNKEVWETAYNMLKNSTAKNIWFDATSLSKKSIKKIIDIAKEKKEFVKILIKKDSLNFAECVNRIEKDLKNKVDRSVVPFSVSKRQYQMFVNLFNESFNDFILPYNNFCSYEWI